ncbi:uncharacterized protein LOC136061897 [Quercus suber]|uniref:uncharacterized protein LOC136061897 n=1 Tax=Quercus suber TaxID=58331 RepID=UPI0032E011E6
MHLLPSETQYISCLIYGSMCFQQWRRRFRPCWNPMPTVEKKPSTMLDVPKNNTCLASDGFESNSNSGNEAPNPGDSELPLGFMIKVHLQSPIPFSMMIPMPIYIHHQRRQKHVDPTLKRRDATNIWEVDTPVKPPNVLFNSFLGSIAHDEMLKERCSTQWGPTLHSEVQQENLGKSTRVLPSLTADLQNPKQLHNRAGLRLPMVGSR